MSMNVWRLFGAEVTGADGDHGQAQVFFQHGRVDDRDLELQFVPRNVVVLAPFLAAQRINRNQAEGAGLTQIQSVPPIFPPPPPTAKGGSLSPERDQARLGLGTACLPNGEVMAASDRGGSWRGGPPEPVPILGRWPLIVLAPALLGLGVQRQRAVQSVSADR
jgi:hypothetical protein